MADGNGEEDTWGDGVTLSFSKILRCLLCSSTRKNWKNQEVEIREASFWCRGSKNSRNAWLCHQVASTCHRRWAQTCPLAGAVVQVTLPHAPCCVRAFQLCPSTPQTTTASVFPPV